MRGCHFSCAAQDGGVGRDEERCGDGDGSEYGPVDAVARLRRGGGQGRGTHAGVDESGCKRGGAHGASGRAQRRAV